MTDFRMTKELRDFETMLPKLETWELDKLKALMHDTGQSNKLQLLEEELVERGVYEFS